MKKMYVVTYDFRDPNSPILPDLSEELTSFPKWWHFLEGTWLICTDLDAKGIYARLRPLILGEAVNLLVLEAGRDSAGWLPKQAWEWIKENQEELTHQEERLQPQPESLGL